MGQLRLPPQNTGLLGPVSFGFGLLLLVLSPLFRGGNRYVALVGLEWLGLLVLCLCIAQLLLITRSSSAYGVKDIAPLSATEWWWVLAPVWLALLFLTPLPAAIWAGQPGRQVYLPQMGDAWRPLTLTPDATVASLLAGIPPAAVFVFVRTASLEQFK